MARRRFPFQRDLGGLDVVLTPDREKGKFTGLRQAAGRNELNRKQDIFDTVENTITSGDNMFSYSVLRIWQDLSFYGIPDNEVEGFLKRMIDVIMYG